MKHLIFVLFPFFTMSEVVQDFTLCKKFFFNEQPPLFTPQSISVRHICQCIWDNNKGKIYAYATLYSTTWKIPIYSAYVFGSKTIGRADAWYIEPQLDQDPEACMRTQGQNTDIGKNQALNRDYENSGYNKGQLYPMIHTDNHVSMLATSTLTNAAPQDPNFNQKYWLDHEKDVAKDLKTCTKAYVVAGVVPDQNKWVNSKVKVSKYYWRATCCQNQNGFIGKGYYGPNNNGKVEEVTIPKLQEILKKYGIDIMIFPNIQQDERLPKRRKIEYPCN
ncbi:endonuclease domain-containing 1 protein [Xyrauchen texanus]|uniref:endonuclease domain-containing 1 protein n=1 Tax=Xyrauchen texanus TaxID=154827 RepID=UPI002241FCB3|nr:endonuclease domain-containing 1 protein [Xyrauchen texanus]